MTKFKDLIAKTSFNPANGNDKKHFWNFVTTRNILFERDLECNDNLFESILKAPVNGNEKFISLLWVEGELWLNNEIISTVRMKMSD